MKIDVLTLFPEMFNSLNYSIIGKAIEKNIIEINLINIRDFSKDKHKKVDDTPYGGGAGMVLMPQPYVDAYESIEKISNSITVMLSPQGEPLCEKLVLDLAKYDVPAPLHDICREVSSVKILMSQHIGAPAIPCVKVGDFVKTCDLIGKAADGLSVNIHASIDGKVVEVTDKYVYIEKV